MSCSLPSSRPSRCCRAGRPSSTATRSPPISASLMCRRRIPSIVASTSSSPAMWQASTPKARCGAPRSGAWPARSSAGTPRRSSSGDKEAADALEDLLGDAVGRRLVSDVPLGAFLSGGIDSSTVAAMMRAKSNASVRTYSIGFAQAGLRRGAACARRGGGARHRAYRALCERGGGACGHPATCRRFMTSPSPIPRRCRPISCRSSRASTSPWRSRAMAAMSCSRAIHGIASRALWAGCPRG